MAPSLSVCNDEQTGVCKLAMVSRQVFECGKNRRVCNAWMQNSCFLQQNTTETGRLRSASPGNTYMYIMQTCKTYKDRCRTKGKLHVHVCMYLCMVAILAHCPSDISRVLRICSKLKMQTGLFMNLCMTSFQITTVFNYRSCGCEQLQHSMLSTTLAIPHHNTPQKAVM